MTGTVRRLELLTLNLAWLAFFLRVFGLNFQSLWRDEVNALRSATRALPQLLETFRKPGENGPAHFLSLRCWLAASGHCEFALRFPSVWAGTLAVPVIYVLVRRLAGGRPASIAALLAATAPYLIWCMPAFLALASLGIAALARIWRPLGATVLAAMLVASGWGVLAQSSQPIKSDFRAAARFVSAHQRPGDMLVFRIPYSRYSFSYYSNGGAVEEPAARGELAWVDGPFTNNGISQAAVAKQMAQETAGARAVWLIASEVPMWDQRGSPAPGFQTT